MIVFEKLRYRNILSTGDAWTELNFNSHSSTLIMGKNGNGKSTAIDALSFVLYGKPFRKINKPQLINSINQKGLEVTIDFSVGEVQYHIRRGMKPNVFEVFKNGVLVSQDAANRDYQTYLEENVLKMSYKTFGQIIVLGSSTYIPFMQLSAAARREVIEDLLDIQIFTTMNTILKDQVSATKDQIQDVKYKIDLLADRIKSAEDHNFSIIQMRKAEVGKIKERAKVQVDLIDAANLKIEEYEGEILNFLEEIQDKAQVQRQHDECVTLYQKMGHKLSVLENNVSFYTDHENCPTCQQGIEEGFRQARISEHTETKEKITIGLDKLNQKTESLKARLAEISKVESRVASLNLKISEERQTIRIATSSLKAIKKELEDAEAEVEAIDTKKIDGYRADLKSLNKEHRELLELRETQTVAANILKDGGIKTRIVKQYIPIINKLVNKYLSAMDFFVDFSLDENFNETIKSRFRDVFSYSSFSEGEKARIDLALMLTWRTVARMRNSASANILIMDEVFDGSLDADGTGNLMDILKSLTDGTNLFIISHKTDQLHDKFDRVIEFEKVKNFSQIV